METFQDRPPLALIACADDWMSRALESVFLQHGFVVAHTRSGAQTMPSVHRRWGTRSRHVVNEQAAYLFMKKKAAREWSKEGITIAADELGMLTLPGDALPNAAATAPAAAE